MLWLLSLTNIDMFLKQTNSIRSGQFEMLYLNYSGTIHIEINSMNLFSFFQIENFQLPIPPSLLPAAVHITQHSTRSMSVMSGVFPALL